MVERNISPCNFNSYKFQTIKKLILVKTKKSKNMRQSYKGGKKDNVTLNKSCLDL